MKTATKPNNVEEKATETRTMIARNFDELLADQRWSKRAAATALGLTHTYVTSRANGTVEMTGSDLALFADFLKVPVSRFFERTDLNRDADVAVLDTSKNAERTSDYGVDVSREVVALAEFRRRA